MAAFTVMPMSKEVSLKAGEVYSGSISVSNPADADSDFDYQIVVSPYSVVDEYYTADFVSESDWSKIVDWIKVEEPTGTIAPNGTKEIKYTISVPADAPAGGQYAVLGVRANPKEGSEGVTVNNVFEMASIIYGRVEGETRHEGEILTNSIPGFVTNGAPMVSATLSNSGNVHEVANVTLSVKNAFTGESLFPVGDDVNVFSEIVMPGSTRYATRNLNTVPMLGVFEVTQDISYIGTNSEELVHNVRTMIVCPLWFLFLLMLTVGAFIGAIAALIHKHRKSRRVI